MKEGCEGHWTINRPTKAFCIYLGWTVDICILNSTNDQKNVNYARNLGQLIAPKKKGIFAMENVCVLSVKVDLHINNS